VAKKAAARGAAGFTELQGQYLAFIRAYSVIHGVARQRRICSASFAYRRLRSIKWW
jgi:hypothetical protein